MRFQILVAIALAGSVSLASKTAAQNQDSPVQIETVEQASEGLDSDLFSVRQAAAKYLEEAGPKAVSLVVDGWLATDSSLEKKTRCETIIEAWLVSDRSEVNFLICRSFLQHPHRPDASGDGWYGEPIGY